MTRIYDLTMDLGDAIRYRRTLPTVVYSSRLTPDGVQYVSEIALSPHAVTHIDLPGSQTLEDEKRPLDSVHESWSEYSRPRVMPAFLLDVSHLRETLTDLLPPDYSTVHRVPYTTLWSDTNGLKRLVDALALLRITKDMLASWLSPHVNIQGAALFLRTGWRIFAPPGYDLYHPLWACSHPHSLSPYLDYEAVEYLLDRGLRVLGSDTHGLDSPLRQFGKTYSGLDSIFTEEASRHLLRGESLCPWPDSTDPEKRYRPVHTVCLKNHTRLIEHLDIPRSACATAAGGVPPRGPDATLTPGRAAIVPVPCRVARECLLASVIFRRNQPPDGKDV